MCWNQRKDMRDEDRGVSAFVCASVCVCVCVCVFLFDCFCECVCVCVCVWLCARVVHILKDAGVCSDAASWLLCNEINGTQAITAWMWKVNSSFVISMGRGFAQSHDGRLCCRNTTVLRRRLIVVGHKIAFRLVTCTRLMRYHEREKSPTSLR